MSPKEAAAILGYSEATLRKWRSQKIGPQWAVCNGRIWYRRDWLTEWEDSVWAKPQGRGGE